ncbi:MAG: response regulator [Anaerolineae bacterium]|nr:response regulator [Anaerolineae bacterium]
MTHVLVIEDDTLVRDALVMTLTEAGYQVSDTPNGLSGLDAIKSQQPDLVLCDITMPGMSGFEVLRETRKDPATVDIPFICVTGRVEQEDRRIGMNLGADDYLTKPITREDLLSTIRYRLGQRAREMQKHEMTIHKLRDNIIYALPHELRTPLTHILGYAEIMKTSADSLTIDEVESMSGSIFRAGERLHHLFENYLVYAQLEMVTADSEYMARLRDEWTQDAASIIADSARTCARRHKREADLQLDLAKSDVRMAEYNLIKICSELIDNAFKFSKPGSPVQVMTIREGDCYHVQIRDRGHGMSVEQINSIGAYMQFDRALYEQQGVGMGFYLARRMVELHNGTFDVYSHPGKGTVVTFTLPA